MGRISILQVVLLVLLSSNLLAQSYQIEVGAAVSKSDSDVAEREYDSLAVFGEYHFDPVQTRNHPLAEAAYLEESSNVFAVADLREAGNTDIHIATAGIEYFVPNTIFYARAELALSRYDGDGFDDSETDWSVTAGLSPIRNLLLTTTYEEEDGYDANISAKYVTAVGDGNFLNVEATIWDTESETFKSLAADYYLDRTLSVGMIVQDQEDTGVGIRARKFFTMDLSGGVAYFNSDSDDTIRVDAAYRF